MKKNTNFIRSSNRTLVIVALLTLIFALSFSMNSAKAEAPRIVYVVISVDTDIWGGHDQFLGSTNPHPTLDMRAYTISPPSTVSQVFDDAFRNSHRDSVGNSFKMTWFAEMDYLTAQSNFVYANGSSAGVSGYTAIRDLLMKNWGAKIQEYGDSVEWQHYFMTYDGTWKRYDNGPDAGYPGYQMYALDHMIIDSNFYPSTFRSGWIIRTPVLSDWLEQWMPYDYTPDNGSWYPTHPAGMNRWQTRSSTIGPNQLDINATFAGARDAGAYGRALYSVSCNSRDNMASLISSLQTYLTIADNDETKYPNVLFQYVTAKEAMQLALLFYDYTEPPTLTITPSGNSYKITSNEEIWNDQPYVALKFTNGTYTHVQATPTATNEWSITSPAGTPIEKIGVAALDLDGNPSVLVISVAPTKYLVTFSQTGLDSSATGTVVTVNGSAKTYTNLPFSMWVDTGKSISYSQEAIVASSVSGKRYRLDTVTGPMSPIIVTGLTNVTVKWKQQFWIQVNSSQGSPTNSQWIDQGGNITVSVTSPADETTGTRYKCTGYTLDSNSPVTDGSKSYAFTNIGNSHVITFNWIQQFLVVFAQAGAPTGSSIHVTVNSIQHTLPYSDWFDKGSSINFTYESSVPSTQYVLASTSGQSPLTIQATTTVTGYYSTSTQSTTAQPYTYTIELIALIAAIIVIGGLTTAIILLKRRKP